MSEYQCENCSAPIASTEQKCSKCDYPQQGSKQDKIAYNGKLLKVKDLVEESDKSVKSVFSFSIIFLFMFVVVTVFSMLFNENHYLTGLVFLTSAIVYFVLNRVGKKSSYIMTALALFFYVGHTVFEFSNGMFLSSPVELNKTFTETRGAALFFALIPLAYLFFRFVLIIVLVKYLLVELRLRRLGKMADFVKNNKLDRPS